MKLSDSHAKNRAVFFIFFSFFFSFSAAPVEGGTLNGRVVGIANNPKPFVRVEIYGSQTMTTFTDNDGKFSVELIGGQYQIQVIEMDHGAQFIVDVPIGGQIDRELRLER